MKKDIALKSFLMVLALICTITAYAQSRTCGMDAYMEEMLKDPVLTSQYENNQKRFRAELARRANGDFSKRGNGTIVIPVAVHFPQANEADRNCLVALAQAQVDILNEDYSATNADISNWAAASAFYPGLQPGSVNISFCLARFNHPTGLDPELIEGEPAVTIGYNYANGSGFPEQDANWSGYLNFLVKPIAGLGYSPRGGSIVNGEPVVMNLDAFGAGSGCPGSGVVPGAPFNLGRTVTHELGHFFNLYHPWGTSGPTCSSDDGITDTPNSGQQSLGCPANGSINACTAPEKVLTMNYMDYANDACMYMFTPGQMAEVDAYITANIAPAINLDVCEEQLSVADLGIQQFLVVPNPNTGEFRITFNSASSEAIHIDVFDIRGRRMFSKAYNTRAEFNQVIRLNNVQSGMYLLVVNDGLTKTTKKIVIE